MALSGPLLVSWSVTDRCNLNCYHCYNSSRDAAADLTTEQMRLICHRLSEAGVLSVSLTGGEPLLREDIPVVVESLSALGISVELNTNGLLISERIVRQLKSAGINGIRVSIDGADEQVHDSARGMRGSFEAAVRAVEVIAAHDIPVSTATVPTIRNANQLADIVEMARNLGSTKHHVFRFVPTGFAEGSSLVLATSVYLSVMRDAMRSGASFVRWEDPVGLILMGNDVSDGCAAGTTYVGIDAMGFVVPCPSLPIPVGNVLQESLSECWHSELLAAMRKREYEPCLGCAARFRCGGCRSMAWAQSGDPLGRDPVCVEMSAWEAVKSVHSGRP